MTAPDNETTTGVKARKNNTESLSKDGKWRSFPKVAGLRQYVTSGAYSGKLRIQGKQIRRSLNTDVFTTAKLRLSDFIKEQHRKAARPVAGTLGEVRAL